MPFYKLYPGPYVPQPLGVMLQESGAPPGDVTRLASAATAALGRVPGGR